MVRLGPYEEFQLPGVAHVHGEFFDIAAGSSLDELSPAKIFDDPDGIFAEDLKALPGKGFGPFGGIENGADGAILERSG